jgi:phage recombination protein Bet
MNELVRTSAHAPTFGKWNAHQLRTMRFTVAPDATDLEFEAFLQYAVAKGLDPFVGDIILVIYNKDEPKKRRPTIITTQSGCRKIAARCRNYRPAEKPAEFVCDETLKGPCNPLGIVSCTVTLHWQDNKGDWHPVNGTAYWDEYAPIKISNDAYEWIDTGETYRDSGRPKKRRQLKKGADLAKLKTLDDSGNWAKMPRVMLEKCATMQALRAGWPEEFGDTYSQDEMERSRIIDVTAAELIDAEETERRQRAIHQASDEFSFVDAQGNLAFIPAGKFADTMIAAARQCKTKEELSSMKIRNREGWRRFWAAHKDDALQMNQEIEQIEATLPAVEQKQQPVTV